MEDTRLDLPCRTRSKSCGPRENSETDTLTGGAEDAASATHTTLMLRNIPCKVTIVRIREALDRLGMKELYDCVYLPRNRCGASNLGYAFINFKNSTSAVRCRRLIDRIGRMCLVKSNSKKVPVFATARIQGINDLRRHFATLAYRRKHLQRLYLVDEAEATS